MDGDGQLEVVPRTSVCRTGRSTSGLHQVAKHLADEEGVPAGLAVQTPRARSRPRAVEGMSSGRLDEGCDVVLVEAGQVTRSMPAVPWRSASSVAERMTVGGGRCRGRGPAPVVAGRPPRPGADVGPSAGWVPLPSGDRREPGARVARARPPSAMPSTDSKSRYRSVAGSARMGGGEIWQALGELGSQPNELVAAVAEASAKPSAG